MTAPAPRPRIVVTGFGPFGDHATNPSWDAAKALGEALAVDAYLLPVTFNAAAQFAGAHLTANAPQPMLFIHLGLAAGRQHLCFERRAQNQRDHRPDELEADHGAQLPGSQPLYPEPRRHRFSRLPMARLIEGYDSAHKPPELAPARLSEDCGSYVCNALLYHSLRACEIARGRGQFADALFLHMPPMEAAGAATLGRYLARQVFSPPPVIR